MFIIYVFLIVWSNWYICLNPFCLMNWFDIHGFDQLIWYVKHLVELYKLWLTKMTKRQEKEESKGKLSHISITIYDLKKISFYIFMMRAEEYERWWLMMLDWWSFYRFMTLDWWCVPNNIKFLLIYHCFWNLTVKSRFIWILLLD